MRHQEEGVEERERLCGEEETTRKTNGRIHERDAQLRWVIFRQGSDAGTAGQS